MYNNGKFIGQFLQFDNVDDEYSDSDDENEDMRSSQSSTSLCSQNSVDSTDSGLPSSSMQIDQSSLVFSTISSTEHNATQLTCQTCYVIAPTIELCPRSHTVRSSCWDLEQIIHIQIQRVKVKYPKSKRLQEKFSSKVPCIICPKIVKATKQT